MIISGIDRLAYALQGRKITQKGSKYIDLQKKLIFARIATPFDVYIARAYIISIFTALPLGLAVYLIFNRKFSALSGLEALIVILALATLLGLGIYNVILFYPGIMANIRKHKIEIALPHTVALMHALSRGNNDIIFFFEVIGKNKKIYGEVSEEANSILLDIRVFNQDIQSALRNAGTRTPSETFKNFVESLSTVITSGGKLDSFFLSKSVEYRQRALDENKSFMEMLGLLSEIYVTGFAAGPLFIITLLVVLGIIGGEYFFILKIVVYILIPGSALLFILFLSSLIKEHESELNEIIEPDQQDEDAILQKARIRFNTFQFMKDPLLKFIDIPETVLYLSIPSALLFFFLSTYKFYTMEFNQMVYEIDDYIIFATLIALIPYSVFVEIHARKISKIVSSFPDLLNRLTSFHESGFTLTKSLNELQLSDLGILNSEVRKMNLDIEWNGSVVQAFKNFGKRVKIIAVLRVATLLESASSMTGNIKETLSIAAGDALTNKMLEEERKTAMKMQIIIIYVSFFIFLYVSYSLVSGFLPQIPDVTAGSEVTGIIGEGITFSGIDKPMYERIFFHAAILVGFFSGLVAGQIGEGAPQHGLKHSILMVLIGLGTFLLI